MTKWSYDVVDICLLKENIPSVNLTPFPLLTLHDVNTILFLLYNSFYTLSIEGYTEGTHFAWVG